MLDRSRYLTDAKVTPEAIKARYELRVAALSGAEQRQASHILITIDDKTNDAAAKLKIDSIAAELKAGANFATVAKAQSKDPGSAAQGGDLGFAGKGMFVPEFEQALFALKQAGDISPVVKTPFGYHLIKLTAIRSEAPPSFASLQQTLTSEVRQAQADDAYNKAVESLDAKVYEAPDLRELAKTAGLPIEQSPVFNRRGGEGLFAERKIVDAAFNDEQTKDRRNSGAITLSGGRTVWLHVSQYIAARKQPLSEVKAQLTAELLTQKSLAKAMEQAQALVKRSASEPESAWLADAKVSITSADDITRNNQELAPELLSAIFRAPAPTKDTLQWAAFTLRDSVALVQITSVTAKSALVGPERQATMGLLAQNQGQQELQDTLALLREETKVTIKPLASAQ
jgi:peptidyl-prolyl cis-trans isomerase D